MLYKQCLLPGTLDLLIKLQKVPALADFYLVGGTALALQLGHRISVDLDLFTSSEFDTDLILEKIQGIGRIAVLDKQKNTLNISLDGTKVDIMRYNYALIEPVNEIESIRLFSLKDIAAAKLSAITNRGSKKDFYDLHELMNHFSLKDMLDFYSKKFPDMEKFMVFKSLTWFEDAEEEPEPEMLREVIWADIKNNIAESVRKLL